MNRNAFDIAIAASVIGAALVLLNPPRAAAQSTTNRGASVLIFPKVVASAARDTVIQLTNTSNSGSSVHCFYVNGALTDPMQAPGPLNPPVCTESDFNISLTAQQPTIWVASQGRPVDGGDGFGGEDPGPVPAVVSDFQGELRCIAVDGSGLPLGSDNLIGTATVQDIASGDIARYNAIGLRAISPDGDGVVQLDGVEYEACPQALRFSHVADGGSDRLVGAGSAVESDYTIVPCSRDYLTQIPPSMTVNFVAYDEMEQSLSASTTIECWNTSALSTVNAVLGVVGSGDVETQIDVRASAGSPSGIVAIVHSRHDSGGGTPVQGSAAFNGTASGVRATADSIVLP